MVVEVVVYVVYFVLLCVRVVNGMSFFSDFGYVVCFGFLV